MKRNLKSSGRFALTSLAAAALCLASPAASALGLGRLSVQSSLGEVLRAEIDITSLTAEEQANLRIRIAPPESYRAANVDYNPVLPTTRATLEKRPDGRMFVRLVSERGVQEPFVDVILEVSWATGRLVREYTLLFDPPTAVRAAAPTAPPAGTTTSPVITASPRAPVPLEPGASTASAREAREAREAARAEARQRRAAERTAAAEARATAARTAAESRSSEPSSQAARGPAISGDEYRVRSGDSLSKIAGRTQRPGVSLDQMLVSLFRANPDAFLGGNMNRLKAGVVLSVPSTETAQGVPAGEARQTIVAQSADFGAYRQRLASSTLTPRDEPSARQATGRVQASVDDKKQSAAPTPDKLTLSKGGVAAGAAASSAEARLSSERARQADAARIAELNKNLEALKRLPGASQAAATAPAATTAPPAGARPSTLPTLPVPSPVVVAAAPTPAVAAPAPALAAVPVPAPVVVAPPAAAPVPAPAPVVTAAASVPAVAAVPTPVVAAASAAPPMASTSSAAAATATARPASAAAAPRPAPRPPIVAAPEPSLVDSLMANPLYLLGGLLAALLAAFGIYRFTQRSKKDSGETSFLESRLQPDSFFGASGGQRIDTRDAAGASSSMTYSLSQLDAIGDVDPVAEADVYLAYGRDLQAEEILKEAMRSNPERLAIRTKLLEVYAKRRDIKGFELLATQLFALTRGEGEDWAKAQELGSQIDPENSLYRDGGAPERHADGGAVMPEPLGASTMPQSVTPTQSAFGHSNIDSDLRDSQLTDVDLDLDDPSVGVPSTPVPLDTTEAIAPRPSAAAPVAAFQSTTLKMPLVANEASDEPDRRDEPLVFDLSGITLDLDTPASSAQAAADGDDLAVLEDDRNGDPVSRKMELAEEFQRIGDKDGARDLLREVLTTATGSTKSRAQSMLQDLG